MAANQAGLPLTSSRNSTGGLPQAVLERIPQVDLSQGPLEWEAAPGGPRYSVFVSLLAETASIQKRQIGTLRPLKIVAEQSAQIDMRAKTSACPQRGISNWILNQQGREAGNLSSSGHLCQFEFSRKRVLRG